MPQHKSAAKRVRQNEKRRQLNRYHKSRMRTMIQKLEQMDDPEAARTYWNELKGYLDRLATKRVISGNGAARIKSRLERRVTQL